MSEPFPYWHRVSLPNPSFNKSSFWIYKEVLSSQIYRIFFFFYSSMTSYRSKDKGKLDFLIHDPFNKFQDMDKKVLTLL